MYNDPRTLTVCHTPLSSCQDRNAGAQQLSSGERHRAVCSRSDVQRGFLYASSEPGKARASERGMPNYFMQHVDRKFCAAVDTSWSKCILHIERIHGTHSTCIAYTGTPRGVCIANMVVGVSGRIGSPHYTSPPPPDAALLTFSPLHPVFRSPTLSPAPSRTLTHSLTLSLTVSLARSRSRSLCLFRSLSRSLALSRTRVPVSPSLFLPLSLSLPPSPSPSLARARARSLYSSNFWR